MTDAAITDSHAFIWYALSRWKKLGPDARELFERADDGDAVIYIPTLALVEVSEASRRGGIQLNDGFVNWSNQLLGSGRFIAVDLNVEIVQRAEEFYAIRERGDRLIAATAAHLEIPLVTRDPEIARVAGVEVVW